MQEAATLLQKYGWQVSCRIDSDITSSWESTGSIPWGEVVPGIGSRPVWRPSDFLEEVVEGGEASPLLLRALAPLARPHGGCLLQA